MLLKCLNEAVITEEVTRKAGEEKFKKPRFRRSDSTRGSQSGLDSGDEISEFSYSIYIIYGDNLKFLHHLESEETEKTHLLVVRGVGAAPVKLKKYFPLEDQQANDSTAGFSFIY